MPIIPAVLIRPDSNYVSLGEDLLRRPVESLVLFFSLDRITTAVIECASMTKKTLKRWYLIISGLNAFAGSYYFYYVFFFMERRFGFGNRENLWLSALSGFIYIITAWYGGRYGQRYGYFRAILIGFILIAGSLFLSMAFDQTAAQFMAMAGWTAGTCFLWPSLEALLSENETSDGIQRMVGLFNLTWAGVYSATYFMGGMIFETLGMESIFWLPLAITLLQMPLLGYLKKDMAGGREPYPHKDVLSGSISGAASSENRNQLIFKWMAWIANPFAYMAINTVAAVVPNLAKRFDLSISFAGIFCSIWFFSRVAAFVIMYLWPGWRYRFRWLMAAYLFLAASFLIFLLVPDLTAVALAQCTFGLSVGVIYYSSLYYSMDVGEAKGVNSGIHESAIGCGIFLGPALGAAAYHLAPQVADVGAWAVSALIGLGFPIMFLVRSLNIGRR